MTVYQQEKCKSITSLLLGGGGEVQASQSASMTWGGGSLLGEVKRRLSLGFC